VPGCSTPARPRGLRLLESWRRGRRRHHHGWGFSTRVLIKKQITSQRRAGCATPSTARARPAGSHTDQVRTLVELREALAAKAERLLLDNLTPGEAAEWVREIDGRATWSFPEASRRTTFARMRKPRDFVSSGAMTTRRGHGPELPAGAGVNALDIGCIRAAFPDRRILYYASLDSTMRAAVGWKPAGWYWRRSRPPDKDAWTDVAFEAARGSYCSMALRPAPALTLALGLAAQSAIFQRPV